MSDGQTEGFRSRPFPTKGSKRMPKDKTRTTKQNNNLHVILQILPGHVPAKISDVDTSALVLGTGNKSTTTGTAGSATLLLGVVSAAGGTLAVLADEDLAAHELGIVEGEDGTLGTLGGGELHDSASLGPAVGGGQDVGPGDLAAGALHVVLEVGPGDIPAEVANVDAAGGVRTRVGLVNGTVVVTVVPAAGGAAGRGLGLGVGRDFGGVARLGFGRRGIRLLWKTIRPIGNVPHMTTINRTEGAHQMTMEGGGSTARHKAGANERKRSTRNVSI